MSRLLLLTTLVSLALGTAALSAPVEGPKWLNRERVNEAPSPQTPGRWVRSLRFRGGERACVTVIGDHDPVQTLAVVVYDEKNNIVAQDRGSGANPDYAAAFWYPPRDGTYRIEVQNPGQVHNVVNVTIK